MALTDPRVARRALVFLPAIMALALVTTVVVDYRNVQAVLETVARGQGEVFLQALGREVRPGTRWDAASLATFLAEQRGAGLRCAAVFGPRHEVLASVGDCPQPEAELRRRLLAARGDRRVDPGNRRLRTAARLPPPAGPPGERRDRPPPEMLDDGPDRPFDRPGSDDFPPPPWGERPDRGKPPGPPRRPRPRGPDKEGRPPLPLLVEFEPVMTNALAAGARRTLGVGSAASLGLMLATVVLWRLLLAAERMQQERERDRRLASLGEMSAVLAHEIKNPLASLKGHAQLLAEKLDPASREGEKAARVVAEVERLESLTIELLDFVRAPRIERRPVDPAAVLRQAAEATETARLDLDFGQAPPRWLLDAGRMHQVLVNLLRNALQSSPGQTRPRASVAIDGNRLIYTVQDRGPGIAAEVRDRLFEPFQTTRVRGTGLGLAVSRRIVELHGGTITAENLPEGGALFKVSIPPA